MSIAAVKAVAPYIGAFLLGAVLAWTYQGALHTAETKTTETEIATKDKVAAETVRDIEHTASEGGAAVSNDGERRLEEARASAAAASASLAGMQRRYDELGHQLTVANANAATERISAAQTIKVLTERLYSLEERAGELSELYDDSYERGITCQEFYNEVKEARDKWNK